MDKNEEKRDLAPPYTGEKKLIKMGSTIYVQVPPEFLKSNGIEIEDIERGKTVMVMANRDMLVSARKEKIEQAHDEIERIIAKKVEPVESGP